MTHADALFLLAYSGNSRTFPAVLGISLPEMADLGEAGVRQITDGTFWLELAQV